VTVTIPQIDPFLFFDDRKTIVNPFGGDLGWKLVTGKHGGWVHHEYLKGDPIFMPFSLALTYQLQH
jgi:hypothetical protein